MRIREHFKYNDANMLTAAHLGISKWNWEYVEHTTNIEDAKVIMQKKEFDVLPIMDSEGEFHSFYSTWSWGDYTHLNKNIIDYGRRVYYKMSFRDLIKKFTGKKDSRYFFLQTHDDIVGLVSVVNFNSLPVYNYLYREISSIEYLVSNFLEGVISEKKVLAILQESGDVTANELASRYLSTVSNNLGSSIFHHLYLSHLGLVIKNCVSEFDHSLKKLGSYAKSFGNEYRELRNVVAHPSRLIVTGYDSFGKIDQVLNDFDEIRELLHNQNG